MKHLLILILFCLIISSCKENISFELPEYEMNLSVQKDQTNTIYIFLNGTGVVNLNEVKVHHNDILLSHRQNFLEEVISDYYTSEDSLSDLNEITVSYQGKQSSFDYTISNIIPTSIDITAPDTIIDGIRYLLANQPYTLHFQNEAEPDYYNVGAIYEKRVDGILRTFRDEFLTTSNSIELPAHTAPSTSIGTRIFVTSHWGPLPNETQYEANELPINFRTSSISSQHHYYL